MKTIGLHFGFLLAAFMCSLLHVPLAAAGGFLPELTSSDLTTLLAGTHTLAPIDGKIRYSNFSLDPIPSGTAIPDLSGIVLTTIGNELEEALLLQIDDGSRVLRMGERYDFGIQFHAQGILPSTILTSAALDIAGATVGTRGDAEAGVTMQLFDSGGIFSSLSVTESVLERQLIDRMQVLGPSDWIVRVRVSADGGTRAAVLVLTDFTMAFGVAIVPEPSTLALGVFAFVALLSGRSYRRRM